MALHHAQLRAFHAVANLGGFTAASREIGITQPALTVQVRALEREFDVQLFRRVHRGVQLTQTGHVLHELTRRYFAIELEASEYLRSAGSFKSGQIRIAADGPYHVIPLLAKIRAHFPDMDINVSFGNASDVLQALHNYDAHLAVSSATEFESQFSVLSRSEHSIVLMVPRAHPFATRKQLPMKQLAGQPLIMRERGSSTRMLFEQALAEIGVEPTIVLELGSREAVREAVAAGLGLGVVQAPEFGDDVRLAAVPFARPPGGSQPIAEECLICLRERKDTPLMRELVTLLT